MGSKAVQLLLLWAVRVLSRSSIEDVSAPIGDIGATLNVITVGLLHYHPHTATRRYENVG